MYKILLLIFFNTIIFSSTYNPQFSGDSKAVVTTIGGIIRAQRTNEIEKKYPRKNCPICKGKGYYISGDGISKIECVYCEADKKLTSSGTSCQTKIIQK